MLYQQYLDRVADRADVHASLAACDLSLGDLQAALEQTQLALRMDARLVKAHVLLGRIYTNTQQWRLAQESFDRALALNSSDRDGLYFSGLAFHEEGQLQKAVERFLKVLAAGSVEGRLYNHLANAYALLGRSQDADAAFQRAIQLAPDDPEILLAYGQYLIEMGRGNDGSKLVRRSFSLRPSPESRFVLARTLYQQAQYAEAAALLEAGGTESDCRVSNLLVKIYREQGLRQKAQAQIEKLTACLVVGSNATP
jgi:superkiller protein 3